MLPAAEIRDRIAAGALRATEVAEAFTAAIVRASGRDGPFVWFDRDHALRQAAALDRHRATGRPIGRLHGVPVAVEDIVETAGIPTANGSRQDEGRVPRSDAAVVERLKAAGALLIGKTAVPELAYSCPGRQVDPPLGAAAAVAAGMVPLAVGMQTADGVIRPAATCGVVGFAPSPGTISRRGFLAQAPSLDTVGVYARDVAGAAMLAEALAGHDPADRATAPVPQPALAALAAARPPVTPTLAFVGTPWWDETDAETRAAFAEVRAALGDLAFDVPLPSPFAQAPALGATVIHAEMAHRHGARLALGEDLLSAPVVAAILAGRGISAPDYLAALDARERLAAGLEAILERCDAILAPAAPGVAADAPAVNGDGRFAVLWSFCGMPAITLPLLWADGDRPIGVQLVGRRGDDARLLRSAGWLTRHLTMAPETLDA